MATNADYGDVMEARSKESLPQSLLEAVAVRELHYKTTSPDWQEGSTEPWVVNVLAALVIAINARTVVEIGGFVGYASTRLANALERLGGGELTVCEIEPERALLVQTALEELRLAHATYRVVQDDSLLWAPTLAEESVDFAWIDGDHTQTHVAQEIELLLPKMRRGGLVCGHDVHGVCRLDEVFARFPNSISLDLPRLGPAGGLGIIQCR